MLPPKLATKLIHVMEQFSCTFCKIFSTKMNSRTNSHRILINLCYLFYSFSNTSFHVLSFTRSQPNTHTCPFSGASPLPNVLAIRKTSCSVARSFVSYWSMQKTYSNFYISQHSLYHSPMPINTNQKCVIDSNADQFFSILLNWLAPISNVRHWEVFWINAWILIGIDRHWPAFRNDLH